MEDKKLKKELRKAFYAGAQRGRQTKEAFNAWYEMDYASDGKSNMPPRTAYKFGYSTWDV